MIRCCPCQGPSAASPTAPSSLLTGSTGYICRGQNPLSFQASSQIVIANGSSTDTRSASAPSPAQSIAAHRRRHRTAAASSAARSSPCHPASSAATFRTCFPTLGHSPAITVPHKIAGTSRTCRPPCKLHHYLLSPVNEGRLSPENPQADIRTPQAQEIPPAGALRRLHELAYSRIFFALPAKSPTVGLIWASAIFTP